LDFLQRLVKSENGRKVFLIVDCHSVHKAGKVEQWVKKNSDKIVLFFLPPYSPELNPGELLNQDVKSNSQRRGKALDKNELLSRTRGFLRSRQRTPEKIKRYFLARAVAYAA
jgi:transposase